MEIIEPRFEMEIIDKSLDGDNTSQMFCNLQRVTILMLIVCSRYKR